MNLPFPMGVSEITSVEGTPPSKAFDARNAIMRDPFTGRYRGSSREGMSKFNTTTAGAGKIQNLSALISDNQRTDYTEAHSSEWTVTMGVADIVADDQGNTYSLVENSIVKVNPDGEEQWRYAVPVADPDHVLGAIEIDPDGGLFAAVSRGGVQATARIWAFDQDDTDFLKIRWRRNPAAYTTRLRWSEGKLYAGLNAPDSARSSVVVYELVDTAEPAVLVTNSRPYPLGDFAIDSELDVATTHAANPARWLDPRAPLSSYIFDQLAWNPTMLDNYEQRIWCWLDASEIQNQVNYEGVQDGDPIKLWQDKSGKGRDLFFDPGAGSTEGPPFYKKQSVGARPSVSFDGVKSKLVSGYSISGSASAADGQKTIFPAYAGGAYAVIMVIKPSDARKEIAIYQPNDSGSGFTAQYVLLNEDAGGAFVPGLLGIGTSKDPSSSGTSISAVRAEFDNRNGCGILTIISNGRELLADGGLESSHFRWNGTPLGICDSRYFGTANHRTEVGHTAASGGAYARFSGEIMEIIAIRDSFSGSQKRVLSVPLYDATANTGTSDPTLDTEVEKLENYCALKYGLSHLLDSGANGPGITWTPWGGLTEFQHPYSTQSIITFAAADFIYGSPHTLVLSGAFANYVWHEGDQIQVTTGTEFTPGAFHGVSAKIDDDTIALVEGTGQPTISHMNDVTGILFSFNANNTLAIDPDYVSADAMTVKMFPQRGNIKWIYVGSGQGAGIAVDSEDSWYTVGARTDDIVVGTGSESLIKLDTDGAKVWEVFVDDGIGPRVSYDYAYPKLAVDKYNNLYVPWGWSLAGTPHSLVVYDSDGNELYTYDTTTVLAGQCVAVNPKYPDYGTQTIESPESVYLGTATTLEKIELVSSADNGEDHRSLTRLVVVAGTVKRFDMGASMVIPTGGSNALDGGSKYVASTELFGKMFFADGLNYRYYDPVLDEIKRWNSASSGEMPKRCSLLTSWRGRAVLARGADDPHNWHMSAKDDPFDWNQFTEPIVATAAISGNNSEAGLVGDVITCLIPDTRERLIFGCDHTIHALYGDPMEGGAIILVSDVTGMAFGAPWCKDETGTIYFFGSRGGVYRMPSGRGPQKISNAAFDARMASVDFSLNTVRMIWWAETESLIIWQVPYGMGTETLEFWRWERLVDAWWPCEYSNLAVQPTAVHVFDGDLADDRVVLLGCHDGYIRRLDLLAKSDDGYTIDSQVTWWPIAAMGIQTRLTNPKINLASGGSSCYLEMFVSDEADAIGEVQQSMLLLPGQNARFLAGVRGAYTGLRLRNAAPGQRWAYESGSVETYPAGRRVGV